MTRSELNKFLEELTELTKKYGIQVNGCGCCGSPYLETLKGSANIGEDLHWDVEEERYTIDSYLPEIDF